MTNWFQPRSERILSAWKHRTTEPTINWPAVFPIAWLIRCPTPTTTCVDSSVGSFVAPPGQVINKPITVSGASASQLNAILAGAARWGQMGSMARYYQVASVTSDSTDITVKAMAPGAYGSTVYHYCTQTPSQYVLGCEISWSTVSLSFSINDALMLKVSAHELGHAMGLGHPNTSVSSVMNQGNIGGLVSGDVTSYDTASCSILYPITVFN